MMIWVPSLPNDSLKPAFMPSPSPTSTITAETPITMPSVVRAERSLFARMLRSAMVNASWRFMRRPPRLSHSSADPGPVLPHLVPDDLAVAQRDHPLGERGDLVLVRDQHDGTPGVVQLGE